MSATSKKSLTSPRRRGANCKPHMAGSSVSHATRVRIEAECNRVAGAQAFGNIPAPKRLYPIADAASLLGLSVWTLRKEVYGGRCAFHRIGQKVLISDVEINRLIAASLRPATVGC